MAERYILEYRTAMGWEKLSENLKQTQVRKRNLSPDHQYFFRVAAVFDDGPGAWMTHAEGFFPLTEEEEEFTMKPPKARKVSDETLVIKWRTMKEAYAYELQLRENMGGAEWHTILEEFEGTEVKKRNLKCKMGYQFRVRALNGEYDEAFSPPSDVVVAVPVSSGGGAGGGNGGVAAQAKDYSMPAPWVKNAGSQTLLIRWADVDGAEAYELQMRENTNKGTWLTIAASLSGTEVKKKNLTSKSGYQFRVRPLGTSDTRYSAPSYGAIASQ
jgi:hypothetical protein